MNKDFEILATIALIFLVLYLNKKEEFNYSFSKFFTQLFAIITRGFKKAGH
jgi:hypothetical protein